MQHYLHLCKQGWGRRLQLLTFLVCLCSGIWAQRADDYTEYYDVNGVLVNNPDKTKKVIKYTFRDIRPDEGAGYKVQLVSCEPYNEDDFSSNEKINLVISNKVDIVGYDIFRFALSEDNNNFWANHLESVTFNEGVEKVNENFMGYLIDDEDTEEVLLEYKNLNKIDFSKAYNIDNITFSDDAFKDFDKYMPTLASVVFKDGRSGLTYSLDPRNSTMELRGFSYTRSKIVAFGYKSFGGIKGRLLALGGVFKGYTDNDFSVAITDGMIGLGDNEFAGSSLVALSLPKSFGVNNLKNMKCGTGIIDDCSKLEKLFTYAYNVPYVITWSNGTPTANYDETSYDFGVSGTGKFDYGLSESDFSNRWSSLSGDIGLTSAVQFLNGCYADAYSSVGGERFRGNTAITGLTIYNQEFGVGRITAIDNNSSNGFRGCTGLKKVTIKTPSKIDFTLGAYSFEGCTALTDVSLGKYVKNINYASFKGCTALKNVEFEKDADCELYIIDDCFNGCTALTTLDLRDRKIVGFDRNFRESSGINTIYFNKNNDDEQLTYAWTTLNSINLLSGKYNGTTTCDGMADGEKVVLLGVANASGKFDLSDTKGKVSFTDSYNKEIVSGNLVRVLDGTLTGYTYVELPYGVDFGNNCFDRTKLTHLGLYPTQGVHVTPTYPKEDMATASGKNFFFTVDRCDADVENIVIPSEVMASNVDGVVMFVGDDTNKIPVLAKKSLWGNAENTTLKSVTFAESSTVGDYVLNIKSNYVPTICAYAFSNCKNLATVKFPTYAFDVEWYAFNDCASLTSVDLRHCRKLSYNAFYNCPYIGAVRFGDQLVEMKDDIFSGDEGKRNTTLKSIVMPQFTLFGDGAWTPSYSAKAFSNLANVKTVVIDPDVSAKNCVSSFDGWKTTLGVLKDNGLNVYVTSAAYDKLKTDASNFEGYDVKAADDYRLMATTTADGEALDNGYGTICLEKAASLNECYNVKAFYRANYDEAKNAVVLSAVATPKAGEPYVYARNNDDPSGLVVFGSVGDDEATSPLKSALVGTFERIYAPKGSYVLQSDNLFHIVGSENKIAVGAHRAYLPELTSSSEAKLSIIEDDQPTGINGVEENTSNDDNAPMYNLSGQRIAAPVSGQIYIIKGKKVVKK